MTDPEGYGYGILMYVDVYCFLSTLQYLILYVFQNHVWIQSSVFHVKLRFSTVWVSQAAAKQRAGRAGRTRPGLPLPGNICGWQSFCSSSVLPNFQLGN